MGKTIIISEGMMKQLMAEQILEKNGISAKDIADAVRDAIKNDRDVKRDFDKRVRELVASSVDSLFRTLWQRRNFYEDEIKKG